LKEDIKVARENNFGRRIFESFASEFSVTHLNDKAETRKLMNALQLKDQQLAESVAKLDQTKKLVETKEREVRVIKESNQREKMLSDLLAPLNAEKASVMKDLLESVQTPKLQSTFDKYLPAVLNSGTETKAIVVYVKVLKSLMINLLKQEVDMDQRDNVIDINRRRALKRHNLGEYKMSKVLLEAKQPKSPVRKSQSSHSTMGAILENTKKQLLAESSAGTTTDGNIATLNRVILPVIRRVMPTVIANETDVQPYGNRRSNSYITCSLCKQLARQQCCTN
jgi:hypothetical protein